MICLVDCNNFWSPSGGGVRRYHLEKMNYYKDRTDLKYVFIMHDTETYTEQIGANAFIEHLKVPKVPGETEYRYLVSKKAIEPLLVKIDPDIIEVGSPYFMPRIIENIIKSNSLKAKVYGFWHADFPVTYVERFLNWLPYGLMKKGGAVAWAFARKRYNKMNGVLVSSQIIMSRMAQQGIENVHFVPLGVDRSLFHDGRRNQSMIDELKAGVKNRLVLFFPHRFCQEKGLRLLLEAYPLLCKKLEHEPLLLLAGTGPDLNLAKGAAKKNPFIQYLGFIEDKEQMAAYYANADLGFALSKWETFGLSLVESLSCGLPLIAANDGASREHIEKSEAGIILQEYHAEALANAIADFVKHADKSEMKRKALSYAEHFTWQKCFDRQRHIYLDTLNYSNL